MVIELVELAAGVALIALTLADILATILVPGPVRGMLKVGSRVRQLGLPIGRFLARRGRGVPGRRPSNSFAPTIFLIAFVTWMLLLLAGYALLFHAARAQFTPALVHFDDAVWIAGNSLLTLGVSEVDAHGYSRWLILAAALSGLVVISATITFIIQIQTSLHQRERRVLTLGAVAGSPPSGMALLAAVAELGIDDELHTFFRDWRDWAAGVLHSHVASPVLIFFHSVDTESDWLAMLEAVLDAATLLMVLTEDRARGAATLMHRVGARTAARLCALLDIEATSVDPYDHDAVEALRATLAGHGYRTIPVDTHVVTRMAQLRADYAGRLAALAEELGADRPKPLA